MEASSDKHRKQSLSSYEMGGKGKGLGGGVGGLGCAGLVVVGGDNGGGRITSALAGEHTLLGGGSGTGGGLVGGPGVLLTVVVGDIGRVGELAGLETEGREVELGEGEEVVDDEDRLGEDVKDTVEDHLRVGVDDRGTVRKSPSDGVEEPEEGEDRGGAGEGPLVCGADGAGRSAGGTEEDPEDVEEGKVTW